MSVKTLLLTPDGDFATVENQSIFIADRIDSSDPANTKTVSDHYTLTGWKFIEGIDALKQRLQNRLKLFKGEWFLDADEGIDWFKLFEKPVSVRRIKSTIKKEIEKDEDVQRVENIELVPDYTRRVLKINLTIRAFDEIINLSEEKK